MPVWVIDCDRGWSSTLPAATLQEEFLVACDRDRERTKPSRTKLAELVDVAEVLHR